MVNRDITTQQWLCRMVPGTAYESTGVERPLTERSSEEMYDMIVNLEGDAVGDGVRESVFNCPPFCVVIVPVKSPIVKVPVEHIWVLCVCCIVRKRVWKPFVWAGAMRTFFVRN